MKTKMFLMVGCIALLSSTAIVAQWQVGGNDLNAAGKFGSLSGKPVIFISKFGAEQGRLTNEGLWGFGTKDPGAKVDINSVPGQTPLSVGIDGITKLSVSSDGGVRIGSGPFIAGPPTNGLHVVGNVGIGITVPETNLHVFRGSAGSVTANVNAPLVVENSTNNYINLLAPSANERGILFGDDANAQDGGIIYVGSNNSMQFRTNTNITRMTLSAEGNLGIGTTASGSMRTYSFTSAASGTGLKAECNSGQLPYGVWGLCSNTETGFAGYFDGNLHYTGTLTGPSDQKLNENIKPLDKIIDKIMKLKPSFYNYKNEYMKMNLPQGQQMGFIAQDMEKVFPELVKTISDKQADSKELIQYKGINYIGLIPLLTKAIQDQQQEIDELKQIVNQLANIKALSENAASAKTTNAALGKALEQNIPNPFNQSTTINYTLPKQFTNAQILIADQNGNVLKRTSVAGTDKGTLTIDAGAFLSGTYTYSLVVDGHLIGSKKMVLTK